jgi:hypothetical protein
VDRQRQLVHGGALDTGGLDGVLLAAPLLEAGEGAVLASGVHERVAACIDLRLAASEVERRGVRRALRTFDIGLHGEEVRAAGVRGRAAAGAGVDDALRGSVQLILAAPVMSEAGGQRLGGVLLGALAQGTDALEAKVERTGTHESGHRRVADELKSLLCPRTG